jgi:hypothetical protein
MAEEESRGPEVAEIGSADVTGLESISSQPAYDAFLVAAMAIEPGFIEECCADVALAYHNVMRGVENVLGNGAVVVGRLPNVNLVELSMLPRLAQGLAFAALQVDRELETASFGTLFERAQQLRRKLRKAADALAEASLLPSADIDEVWLHAQQDVLDDTLALVALLRRNEPRISGRSPVTAAELLEAEQAAEKLRAMLGRQGDVNGKGTQALVKAIEMRDRFWTLLTQRYEVLWRCGAWLYGRAVDERVPPLPIRRALIQKPSLSAPPERDATRTVPEPARSMSPPALLPEHVKAPQRIPAPAAASGASVHDSTRHLHDLQREMERKARFLVRIGVTSPRS